MKRIGLILIGLLIAFISCDEARNNNNKSLLLVTLLSEPFFVTESKMAWDCSPDYYFSFQKDGTCGIFTPPDYSSAYACTWEMSSTINNNDYIISVFDATVLGNQLIGNLEIKKDGVNIIIPDISQNICIEKTVR
jgi:hypothetical protein